MSKDFKDFEATLTEEQMLEIFNKSAKKVEAANPEGSANAILAISMNCTIELLRAYHEWIDK